jgi:hypothetical protein
MLKADGCGILGKQKREKVPQRMTEIMTDSCEKPSFSIEKLTLFT